MPLTAAAQDVNAEREHWALHARNGQAELAESIAALRKLYAQSKDTKVRADLIALLVRQGKPAEALAVCGSCKPVNYTSDELENLAKAARDNKQFAQSAALYAQLQQIDSGKKIGFLGGALASSEAGKYAEARTQINEYRQRFGNDADITQAENYLKDRSQTLSERLFILQKQLEQNPDNKDLVLQTYRTAAQLQAFPVQESLTQRYPHLFTQKDLLWLKLSQAVGQLRANRESGDMAQLEITYQKLTDVVNEAPEGSDLKIHAMRDRMAASIALGKDKQALEDYNLLRRMGEQPQYVKEQYAQALSMNGNPITARAIYEEIAAQQKASTGAISPTLTGRLVESDADAGYYTKAQERLKNWNPKKKVSDFTHTREVDNPYYNQQFFWNVRLEAWNGNYKKAMQLMDSWLAEHPGDPWAMVLRGDLSAWNDHEDEAVEWYTQAKDYIPQESRIWVDTKIAAVWINDGNWSAVKKMAAQADRNNPAYKTFWEQYDKARAAQLSISASAMKATSPKESTEWGQNATLYSPRSMGGHRAYITEQSAYVPNKGNPLRAGRVGVGAEISLHPVTINAEAGHGTQLNDKAYVNIGADYHVNERLSLSAKAAHNSANVPTKALQQKVYADEYNIGATYSHSAGTRAGIGAGVMTFDDDNVRKSVYGWVSQALYQHNRWKLDSSLWADYSHNKDIPAAYYYNPRNSKSLSGSVTLSYALPLDHGIRLNQQLTAGLGRYWQAGQSSENTWLLKYGHDWSLGKKTSMGYEFGRKQSIYDGAPEFQNFGNVNLNVKFK